MLTEQRNSLGSRTSTKGVEMKHSYKQGDTYPVPVGVEITNDFLRRLAKELKQTVCTEVYPQLRKSPQQGFYVDVPAADGKLVPHRLNTYNFTIKPLRWLVCQQNGGFMVSEAPMGVVVKTKK